VNSTTPTENGEILSGWKDIARYLGRGVRTVQRYEEQFKLPVRRPAARIRGSVSATKADLDAWVLASMVREPEESAPILPNVNAQDLTASLEVRHYLRAELRQGIRQLCFARQRLLEEVRLVRSALREDNDRG
jgi:hypothetical protein